ncbi:hypothetical protein HTV45_08060 [Streptomyces sp. CHD11]|nr:hypothetical protein [Streptomyces sp. CHD11]
MYGIAVARTVANRMFASGGSSAMCRTVRATSATSVTGSGTVCPFAWRTPVSMRRVMSAAALPMSIWPTAIRLLPWNAGAATDGTGYGSVNVA